MQNEVHPLSRRGIDPEGKCGLCGTNGPLSRTHVPPQCAGNTGEEVKAAVLVSRRDELGSNRLGAGRHRAGGAKGYLLCESCNNAAGRFDDAFGEFWHDLAHDLLVVGRMTTVRGPYPAAAHAIRPGAIVRSVLAGCMGLCPGLRDEFPVLVESILTGRVCQPPQGLHLLLALYAGPERWVSGGGAERVRLAGGRHVYAHAEIVWPPIYLVLTDGSGRQEWSDAMDILPWLHDEPDNFREVSLLLPVLQGADLFSAELRRDFSATSTQLNDGQWMLRAP
jgi:hypothetical protein